MANKVKKCDICKTDMIKVYTDDDHEEYVWECPACEVDADDFLEADELDISLTNDDCLDKNDLEDDDGEHGYPDEEFLKWKNIQDGRKER